MGHYSDSYKNRWIKYQNEQKFTSTTFTYSVVKGKKEEFHDALNLLIFESTEEVRNLSDEEIDYLIYGADSASDLSYHEEIDREIKRKAIIYIENPEPGKITFQFYGRPHHLEHIISEENYDWMTIVKKKQGDSLEDRLDFVAPLKLGKDGECYYFLALARDSISEIMFENFNI